MHRRISVLVGITAAAFVAAVSFPLIAKTKPNADDVVRRHQVEKEKEATLPPGRLLRMKVGGDGAGNVEEMGPDGKFHPADAPPPAIIEHLRKAMPLTPAADPTPTPYTISGPTTAKPGTIVALEAKGAGAARVAWESLGEEDVESKQFDYISDDGKTVERGKYLVFAMPPKKVRFLLIAIAGNVPSTAKITVSPEGAPTPPPGPPTPGPGPGPAPSKWGMREASLAGASASTDPNRVANARKLADIRRTLAQRVMDGTFGELQTAEELTRLGTEKRNLTAAAVPLETLQQHWMAWKEATDKVIDAKQFNVPGSRTRAEHAEILNETADGLEGVK